MKGFIQRLALLIHWVGFLALLFPPVAILSGGFEGDYNFDLDFLLVAGAYIPAAFFFWVLKWLIAGNKSIWPWQS
tara:strand:+ start:282 stop:506 length:225 start_codon:yes stop_codon:yes gene_type:complete